MPIYVCNECQVRGLNCQHGNATFCNNQCVREWNKFEPCRHLITDCLVCHQKWYGDRTLCLHTPSEFYEVLVDHEGWVNGNSKKHHLIFLHNFHTHTHPFVDFENSYYESSDPAQPFPHTLFPSTRIMTRILMKTCPRLRVNKLQSSIMGTKNKMVRSLIKPQLFIQDRILTSWVMSSWKSNLEFITGNFFYYHPWFHALHEYNVEYIYIYMSREKYQAQIFLIFIPVFTSKVMMELIIIVSSREISSSAMRKMRVEILVMMRMKMLLWLVYYYSPHFFIITISISSSCFFICDYFERVIFSSIAPTYREFFPIFSPSHFIKSNTHRSSTLPVD
jgi:hypothetical protein